ncbi:MAG TPA: hypothetical protein VIF62_02655, partial [Labilithrix sp.]
MKFHEPLPAWVRDAVVPLVDEVTGLGVHLVHVELGVERFLDVGARLFAAIPADKRARERTQSIHVRLTGAHGRCAELAACPHGARLFSLDLSLQWPRLDDADAIALAASPHFTSLRCLDLAKNQIGMPGFDAIAAATKTRWLAIQQLELHMNAAPDPHDEEIQWDGGGV